MLRSGIYFILNNINLKLYIGSAVYLIKRRSEHFTRLAKNIHHNEHLQRAYNKYGPDAFDFIIIEFCDINKLLDLETYYIAKHRVTEEEFGYNNCHFGRSALGRKHSPETIQKIRKANTGKKRSEEICKAIGISSKGRTWSDERKLKSKTIKRSEESKIKTSETMKARFVGQNAATNKAKMSKAANARWGEKPPLVLTQPPIMIKDLV